MTAILITIAFLLFAALMLTRKLPAILAVPLMALTIAVAARIPLDVILNQVIAAGATRLSEAYIMVFAGAILGRVVMSSGIAEGIIKRAAEFGGDRQLLAGVLLMSVVAVLFLALFGLGAIMMVGGLVLPIMMSLGIPRKLAGVLFMLAYGLGFIFNIGTWGFYQKALNLDPQAIKGFAAGLALIDAIAIVIFLVIASRRMQRYGAWAIRADDEPERQPVHHIPLVALLVPVFPLVLHLGFKWHVVPSFLASTIAGILITRPRETIRQLTSAMIRGLEDAAPAMVLMIGIGMLLNATTLPQVQGSLKPVIASVQFASPVVYVAFFGLLSPLTLYRGPLNPYGIGIGLYSLLGALGLLPPLALLAAVMSVVQVQNVCDPTNTQNVWVANFVGIRVEEITRETLIYQAMVCLAGLVLGSLLYLR